LFADILRLIAVDRQSHQPRKAFVHYASEPNSRERCASMTELECGRRFLPYTGPRFPQYELEKIVTRRVAQSDFFTDGFLCA